MCALPIWAFVRKRMRYRSCGGSGQSTAPTLRTRLIRATADRGPPANRDAIFGGWTPRSLCAVVAGRSEEHTSELQSLMRISYAVFCLKKKKHTTASTHHPTRNHTK